MAPGVVPTRQQMLEFWEKQSQNANANYLPEKLNNEEVTEIISILPNLHGKSILELGAGAGRFTRQLSKVASTVIAVDFIDKFISQNKSENATAKNIDYRCQDVASLQIPEKSVDVVFCNWLLMYFDDEECRSLLTNILSWLKEDGILFFRESCFHQSGNETDRVINPTVYRVPQNYMDMIESVQVKADHDMFGYEVVLSKSIQAYAKNRHNNNQICWLLSKVHQKGAVVDTFKTYKEFLDAKQYSRNGILRYEKIFGRHFVSTGGLETTELFVKMLDLKPGMLVLDMGSGIGGSAFYMADKHDVNVLGIDLSSNMVNIGLERANDLQEKRVQFEITDATKRNFPEASFDVIYSRDAIMHIDDKRSLYSSFLKWLKPGGKLLVSDYCCGEGELSEDYLEYRKQRGYFTMPVKDYGKILEDVGFCNVKAEDKKELFIEVLNRELEKAEHMKEEYVKEFSMKDYSDIVDGWKIKLVRVAEGHKVWGLFRAQKPLLH